MIDSMLLTRNWRQIFLKPKHWFVFITLGAVWSASFLWIKIAIVELGPFTVVAYRLLLGLAFTSGIVFLRRLQWPRNLKEWMPFFIIGVINMSIPFFLVTWSELHIDSAVASILNATVPLFTLLIAHFFLHDDRITAQKLIGLSIGFGGVVVLLSKDIGTSQNSILGQMAVILASLLYAISTVYARKNTLHVDGIVRGTSPLVSAAAVSWIAAFTVESPIAIPTLSLTWIALLWLGILSSGLAFIMVFYLIHEIGPTRTTMVTYLFPIGGVILGVIFLNEHLSWQLITGTILIIASLAVVNWKTTETK